jgi:putative membrane protein
MAGWSWEAWGGMALLMLLFWLLLIGAVVALLRIVRTEHSSAPATPPGGDGVAGTAESVLAERYARGEIEEEEFLRRRSILRGR